MKNVLLISGLVAFVFGCSSPETKVENAKEDLKEAKIELHQEKVDSINDFLTFKKESEMRIEENQKAIDAFKASLKAANRKIEKADQKVIDELEQRNIDMRKKIDEYQENGKDKWEAFKKEFSHDMDDLGLALKNLTVKNTK